MRILLFSQFAGSVKHGMVFRNYALARAWTVMGHDVTVVASSFAHLRISQPKTKGWIARENIDGIQYLWVRGPQYNQFGMFRRLFAEVIYTINCAILFPRDEQPYDIVICSSPPPFLVYKCRALARRWKSRLVFDMRDIFALKARELSKRSERNPYIRALQHAEDFACRHADLVLSVPRNAKSYLGQRGLEEGRFLHIGNGVFTEEVVTVPMLRQHLQLIEQLKRDDCLLVGYAGALGIANAMDTAVRALALAPKRIHLFLAGDGGCKGELVRLVREVGVEDRVHFLGTLSPGQVKCFLDCMDAVYCGTQKSPVFSLGLSPTKLNNYMLAAKPVVYAVGDPGNPVEVARCGVVCEPENPHAVADALERIIGLSKSARSQMGEQGRAWCLAHQRVSDQAFEILARLQNVPARYREGSRSSDAGIGVDSVASKR